MHIGRIADSICLALKPSGTLVAGYPKELSLELIKPLGTLGAGCHRELSHVYNQATSVPLEVGILNELS